MARVNLPLAVFLSGASIFCAAGWSTNSFAAWASHLTEGANDSGAANGTAMGALAPAAAASSYGGAYSNTSNGLPSSLTAPALAPPTGFERPMKRARELDGRDPWSGEAGLRTAVRKKLELEGVDPWNAGIATSRVAAPKRLILDDSDPWSGITGVYGASSTKSSF